MQFPTIDRFFFILLPAITLSFLQTTTWAADYDGLMIDKITITNSEIPKRRILNLLDFAEGDPLTESQLRAGFKNLYRMGVFDDLDFDVQIVETQGEDRIHLTIIAYELSKIRKINFIGNQKYSDDILTEEIPAQAGNYYTEALMRQVRLFIKDKYREDGYLMTEVTTLVKEIPDDKEVEVTVDIIEGLEMLVGKIRFYGNKNLSDKQLKRVLESKEDKWYQEGKFDDLTFEADKERLILRYKKDGYYRAKIDQARLSYRWKNPKKKKARNVNIDIWFTEGDVYYFGKTTIKGNKLFKTAEIEKQLRRYPGDYYDEETHQGDLERVTLMYHSRGYIFARITPIEHVNEEDKTVDYVFDIYEGDKAHVEKIIITGNEKTKEHVIRREIEIREGEIFNRLKIQRSLEKLTRTQFFSQVVPEPRPGSVEGLMNLIFRVEEQRTGLVSAGAGWGTTSGFSLNFEIREANFLGRGWGLGAKADLGLHRQVLDVSFTEPYLFGKSLSSRFSVFFIQNDQFLSAEENLITNITTTITTNTNDGMLTFTTNIETNVDNLNAFTREDVNELPLQYRSVIDRNRPALPYKSANVGFGVNTGYRFGRLVQSKYWVKLQCSI